jgi:hypothetical protein
MILTKLRNSLPSLNGESLDFIFNSVYNIVGILGESKTQEDGKLPGLLKILQEL